MRSILLGVALGLSCMFAGMVIDRYLLWEPPSSRPPSIYRIEGTQTISAALLMNCSKENKDRARTVLKTCIGGKL